MRSDQDFFHARAARVDGRAGSPPGVGERRAVDGQAKKAEQEEEVLERKEVAAGEQGLMLSMFADVGGAITAKFFIFIAQFCPPHRVVLTALGGVRAGRLTRQPEGENLAQRLADLLHREVTGR